MTDRLHAWNHTDLTDAQRADRAKRLADQYLADAIRAERRAMRLTTDDGDTADLSRPAPEPLVSVGQGTSETHLMPEDVKPISDFAAGVIVGIVCGAAAMSVLWLVYITI